MAYDGLLPGQLGKLKKTLEGSGGRAAVFMHYPPAVIPHWEEGYWSASAPGFMKMLEDYGVRYFFSGHIHVYDRLRIGPTSYIVTGGGGDGYDSQIKPDELNSPDGGGFPHFVYVAVTGDEASDAVVRLEP